MAEERLQKILAQAGYGSRRAAEVLIETRRVRVNGKVAILGQKADPQVDRIEVDGKALPAAEKLVYIALYKPRYVLSSVSTPDARRTVRDLVDTPERVYPVGRLDMDSEGLILMTNDGELANRLTHPRYGHEKEYRVLVARRPDAEQLAAWRRGVVLEDGYRTQPVEVSVESPFGKGAWLRVIMHEGRKRQIRETGRLLGLPVVRIIRMRIGELLLGSMKPNEWRYLTEHEVLRLKGEAPEEEAVRTDERRGQGQRRASRFQEQAASQGKPRFKAPRGTPRGEGPAGQRARRGKPGGAQPNRGPQSVRGSEPAREPDSEGRSPRGSWPGGAKPSRPPQGKTGARPKRTRGTPLDTDRPARRDQGKGRDRRPGDKGRK